MKLLYIKTLLIAITIMTVFNACKKEEITTFTNIKIPGSSPIAPGNISGFLKGTFLKNQTYVITADITVKKGDTLASQPGAIIIVKNNAQINIKGVLQLLGSKEQQIGRAHV